MAKQQEKVFADGFSFKRRDNAPEFVVGRMSIKIDDAIAFMKQKESNGWINLNINQARSGSYYVELDTYTPEAGNAKGKPSKAQPVTIPDDGEDVPF